MKGHVYFLCSQKNGSYYIGSSKNLERRIEQHNKGYVKYNRNLMPLKLVFAQEYSDIRTARQIEYKLKKLKRKDIIEAIIRNKRIWIKL